MRKIFKKIILFEKDNKKLTIRKADNSDFNELLNLALELQYHVEQSDPGLWHLNEIGKERMKEELNQMLNEKENLVILIENVSDIIGFAFGSIQENLSYSPQRVGKIEKVFIKKNWRRKGLGNQLVAILSQYFQSKNIKEITLRYAQGNKEGELFWKDLGFNPLITTANTQLDRLKENLNKKED
ncbi:MAG: GNAT family N-acetyltransferase [Promethearchaeota archaeon]|nr:MAG: GNAT family N-acetyltransferase [Candidatus Lokiarchaeota archaeon]